MAGSELTVKALDETTWRDFARLVEKHNGVWGGCWCMGFHPKGLGTTDHRSEKESRVREGRAHAALVYDGAECVGWCQFGSAEELPRIKRMRAYTEGLDDLPEWRITCFFVDKEYRRQGVASKALEGALAEIKRLGGGTVESYPEDATDRKTSGGFLHNATLSIFERHGFTKDRQVGKHHWVVRAVVPRPGSAAG